MTLYLVRRDIRGWDHDELMACALRAVILEPRYPGFHWFRSYLDEAAGTLTCVIEAVCERDVRDMGSASGLPTGTVRAASMLDPARIEAPEVALSAR